MRLMIIASVIIIALGTAYAWFVLLPGPQQLDMADNLFREEAPVKRVVRDMQYGEKIRQTLDIWVPEENTESSKPVIIFFYGGSWNSGDKGDYRFVAKAYAASGFIVVLPDYRLYPEAVFPAMIEDSAVATAWVHANIARYGGDPDNIFLAGHSAGAYNAVMVALDRQWLGRLGLDTDIIKGVAAIAGPYDFYPFTSAVAKDSFGEARRPEDTQPVNYARKDAPPLWLATGDGDETLEPRNGRELAAKMNMIGGEVHIREYAGLDHYDIVMALSRPFRSKAPVLADSVAFMRAHMKRETSTAEPEKW